MALGSLIIQTRFQYSDRELVEQITENPYLQYFIGLPGYQEQAPFDASTLVLFRKRISSEMLMEANEYQDNTDRIEVERTFSLSKRCYGMSCITTPSWRKPSLHPSHYLYLSRICLRCRDEYFLLFYICTRFRTDIGS